MVAMLTFHMGLSSPPYFRDCFFSLFIQYRSVHHLSTLNLYFRFFVFLQNNTPNVFSSGLLFPNIEKDFIERAHTRASVDSRTLNVPLTAQLDVLNETL